MKSGSQRDSSILYPRVYCSTIHNDGDMETMEMSIDEWIKKMCVCVYVCGVCIKSSHCTPMLDNIAHKFIFQLYLNKAENKF